MNLVDDVVNDTTLSISDIVGEISGEYPCMYASVNGTLYAGSEALYFLGRYFLFQKKVVIKWTEVRQVQKSDEEDVIVVAATSTSNDNSSIRSTRSVRNKNASADDFFQHVFSGIANSDRVWQVLISLHNEALLDKPSAQKIERGSIIRRPSRSSIVRTNSDPLMGPHENLTPALKEVDENTSLRSVDDNKTDMQRQREREREREKRQVLGDKSINSESSSAAISTTTGDYQVDGMLGKIDGRFPCKYGNYVGSLFAGVVAVCFLGQGFVFFPKKIIIQWKDVKQFRVIPNGVEFLLKPQTELGHEPNNNSSRGTDTTIRPLAYVFTTNEPDRVWASLVDVHHKYLTESQTTNKTKSPKTKRRSVLRRNSDPSAVSGLVGYLEDDGVELALSRSAFEAADKAEQQKQLQDDHQVKQEEKECTNNINSNKRVADSFDGINEFSLAPQKQSMQQPKKSKDNFEKAWSDMIHKKSSSAETVVKDFEISCNLETFYKSFLANDAKYPITDYLKEHGDTDIQAAEWTAVVPDDDFTQTREVHYIHPVNAPLAPPMAQARKEQNYKRFGDCGLCVTTSTYVEDVPMTDCFYVSDRLIVQPKTSSQGEVSVILTMEYEFIFVKSTMFRGVITRTGSAEFITFLNGMAKFMSKSLGQTMETTEVKEKESSTRDTGKPADTSRQRIVGPRASLVELAMESRGRIMMLFKGINSDMVASAATTAGNNLLPLLMILVIVMQIGILMQMTTLIKTVTLLFKAELKNHNFDVPNEIKIE